MEANKSITLPDNAKQALIQIMKDIDYTEEQKRLSIQADLDKFKEDLKGVVDKHILKKHKAYQYNGQDNYIGDNVYLEFKSGKCYQQTLHGILRDCFGDLGVY